MIRDWIGTATPPTDPELIALHDDLGSPRAVVESTLRRRWAEFVSNPASFGVSGQYTQNAAANIEALERALARLAGMPDDLGWDEDEGVLTASTIGVQRMRRIGFRR